MTLDESQLASTGSFDFPTATRNESVSTDQYSFELLSDWTDRFSTLVRVGSRETQQRRTPLGQAGGPAGSDFMSFNIRDIDGAE